MNTPFVSKPVTVLTNPQLIKEFFKQEMNISVRKDLQSQPPLVDMGFFYQYNQRSTKMRGAFADIFRFENLVKITPLVAQIVDDWLLNIKQKIGFENSNGKTFPEFVDYNFVDVSAFNY